MPLDNTLTTLTTSAPSIATYNATDIAKGTGQIIFYPMDTYNDNILSGDVIYSQIGYLQATGGDIAETNFSIKLLKPITILGTFLANVPVSFYKTSVGSDTITQTLTLRLKSYDGSTYTTLETITGVWSKLAGEDTQHYKVLSMNIDITTRHHIVAGDYLVVSLELEGTGGTVNQFIGIDPTNRLTVIDSGTWDTISQSKVIIPREIEL